MSRRKRMPGLVALFSGALLLLTGACESADLPSSPEEATGFAKAYGIWTPGPYDTCTKAIHDGYSVVGPDGKLYPTWHPPTDPQSGCTFGHEHGRDPRGSDLYGIVGDIPFALANEAMDSWEFALPRHEDHFGHKVEWANDIQLTIGSGAGSIANLTCDILTKLHQGTHSKDAFTNNLHEIVYHLRCNDGTRVHVTFVTAIGTPGELVSTCDNRRISIGTPSPPDSPSGGGVRRIPTAECVAQHILVGEGDKSSFSRLRETWQVSGRIKTAEGKSLFSFNPYYQVFNPSRYYDPNQSGIVGRPLEDCFLDETRRARGDMCDGSQSAEDQGYDNPGSQWDGAHRQVDINANRVRNSGGPEIWYSDPFGRNAKTEPFPGSVLQFISSTDNSAFDTHGPTIGKNRPYGGSGVHAPN